MSVMCETIETSPELLKINIEKPRYDQNTYLGRARHFFLLTNPLNILASEQQLENAKCVVQKHRCKEPLPADITEEDLWHAKTLYDSAFHPDTGEKIFFAGRMSAQVPMNMLINAGMLTFYRSPFGVIFWQWINQSFNALVNYSNRGGDAHISNRQLKVSYVSATGGAVITALVLNRVFRCSHPFVRRCVPFLAVAAANCVNIPLMRAQELKDGTPVYDECNKKLGYSKVAAQSGVTQVIVSRISMAAPALLLAPLVMSRLERRGTLCRYPWLPLPVQLAICGLCLTFATPLACAFFKQRAEIHYHDLECELKEKIKEKTGNRPPYMLFYNKESRLVS